MKVSRSMIARDLRICGDLYRLMLSRPAKKNTKPEKTIKKIQIRLRKSITFI
jgi:hypothetical protein